MVALARATSFQISQFGHRIDDRDRITDLLDDSGDPVLMRLAYRIDNCCSCPGIFIDETAATVSIRSLRCKSRLCPLCRESIAKKYMARAIELMHRMDSPKLLTLTIRSSDRPLHDQIQHLKESFTRLRRQKGWKARVAGGLATFEITFNETRGQWHPHLHAIIDSPFYPLEKLRSAWQEATGDSSIVDIRRVNSKSSAASYIAKYVSKSNNAAEFPDARIAEWASEVRSLRFFTTFGIMHGMKTDDPDAPEVPDKDHETYTASPTMLLHARDRGDNEADVLYRQTVQLAHRRVPDADTPAFTKHQAIVCDLARRLRAWVRYFEEGCHREIAPPPATETRNRGPDHRQLRLGEILAPPPHI